MASDSRADAIFLFSGEDRFKVNETVDQVKQLDGEEINRFSPRVAGGKLDCGQAGAVKALPRVDQVIFDQIDSGFLSLEDLSSRVGINSRKAHFVAPAVNPNSGQPLINDDLDLAPEMDGRAEMMAGTKTDGGPQVRAFGYNGKVIDEIKFFAYDKRFRGGVVPPGGSFSK